LSCNAASRRPFSSSGIASGIVRDGVFGLGEYLNENKLSYCTSSSKLRVSSKSDSVSPGKPTMMSVVMAISRLAPRIMAIFSRYSPREYVRCIALSTFVEPDCTGKCTWSQIFGCDSIASTMSFSKSLG